MCETVSREVKLATVSASSLTPFRVIKVVAWSLACDSLERIEKQEALAGGVARIRF